MQQTVWAEYVFVCDLLFDQISQLFIFIRVSITTEAYFEQFFIYLTFIVELIDVYVKNIGIFE